MHRHDRPVVRADGASAARRGAAVAWEAGRTGAWEAQRTGQRESRHAVQREPQRTGARQRTPRAERERQATGAWPRAPHDGTWPRAPRDGEWGRHATGAWECHEPQDPDAWRTGGTEVRRGPEPEGAARRPGPAREPRQPEPAREPRRPQERRGDGRGCSGRRQGRPRIRFGRLFTIVLASLLGSAGVVGLAEVLIPAKQPVMMADPLLDMATLYQSRLPDARAARDSGRAYWPGELPPAPPPPFAGLSQAQTTNAWYIVQTGKQLQMPQRAYIIAIMTALQETNLRNLANPKVPASMKLPHDGTGTNYDSIGLFQQRPSQGWGTAAQLMDPTQSAARFYARLNRVSGWQSLSLGGAAQAVQRSAFPSAYTKHEALATTIVKTLDKYTAAPLT